jgi:hypothetical protein
VERTWLIFRVMRHKVTQESRLIPMPIMHQRLTDVLVRMFGVLRFGELKWWVWGWIEGLDWREEAGGGFLYSINSSTIF